MSVTAEPTDSDLVERMASGDREAFAALFRRHQATVYRFSRQMLGSTEAAEDVTQDVFVALGRSGGRFDPAKGSLSTYLYGVARNLILQRQRRGRRRIEVDIESLDVESAPALTTVSDPTEALSRTQMIEDLRVAIACLPVRYREVIVLCELNDLSYDEAAAIVGCPVGTVRSRLSRARRMLVERCRMMRIADNAEGRGQRANKWLIATKNNC